MEDKVSKAAPEMLSALEMFLRTVSGGQVPRADYVTIHVPKFIIQQMLDAVAKARGD